MVLMKNSVDPDQLASEEASSADLDLHCFQKREYYFERVMLTVHLIRSSSTPDRWQSKMLILLTKVDQKSLETEVLIAICCLTCDKWQSKRLFSSDF